MRLPESWVQTTIANVLTDLQPGFAQKPGDDDDGMTPQIRTHNVTPDGRISLEGIKFVSASSKELERYRLLVGDVVFNNTNSEEWVGKTAVFDQEGEYLFSNHMTRLRANNSLIDPTYLGLYLHLLWSMGYSRTRAKRWVSQAGIEGSALASFKLPLPTLPEQQRIVDVLKQAEAVAKGKRSISDLVDQLVRTLYWECFGAWYTNEGLRDPVRVADCIEDSQYGVSEAMGDSGSHAVLRMNSMTSSGWLDLSDLKYANLDKKDAQSTQLRDGDLLFNRTNSKELVGKCAIWRGSKENFSFASYLIRLRLTSEVLPEYLWATLNSAYGKYRLMNSAKQAVSMANVSPTDLGRITIPMPPLHLQEAFARRIRGVETLRAEMLNKLSSFDELQSLVIQRSLLGELTVGWRDRNQQLVNQAAELRDQLLRAIGAKVSVAVEVQAPPERQPLQGRSARQALIAELSDFQAFVFKALEEWKATLLADDSSALDEFAEQWPLEQERNRHDRVRRALDQLAALGLVAKVSLPNERGDYVTGFRCLRSEEESRARDINRLQGMLNIGFGPDVAVADAEVGEEQRGSIP